MSVVAFLTLALTSAAAPVAASPSADGRTFSVSYRAAQDCPNQATFEAAILAREPRAHKVDESSAQVRLQVELPASDHEKPRLRAVLSDGTSQDREIVAEGCAEAMQSMAVIAAMILEAQPAELLPAPAPLANDGTTVPVPVPASARAAGRQPERETSVPPAARQAAARRWFASTVSAVVESAVAPSAAWGGSASIELGHATTGPFAPSLRLGFVLAQAAQVQTSAGSARFRLLLARAHLCGVDLEAGRANLRVCSLLDAGTLIGQGIDARNEREQAMPWLGVGLGALGAVELAGPLALELGAGGRALIVHDEFVFAPGLPVHQVSVFAWNLSMGLKYSVW